MSLQREKPPLVLASGSAARARLLAEAGLRFEIRPADFDEATARKAARAQGCTASEAACQLAIGKALLVSRLHPGSMVIAADQILSLGDAPGDIWLEKPAGRAEAAGQLRMLRGREHVLASAVVCATAGTLKFRHVGEAGLRFRNYSDALLEAVLTADAASVGSSVGGYRLEGPGILLCEAIEGDFPTILGLPLLPLLGFLRAAGIIIG
ncbi:MAG: Maf family protein [Acetobacteraceae bacterium]